MNVYFNFGVKVSRLIDKILTDDVFNRFVFLDGPFSFFQMRPFFEPGIRGHTQQSNYTSTYRKINVKLFIIRPYFTFYTHQDGGSPTKDLWLNVDSQQMGNIPFVRIPPNLNWPQFQIFPYLEVLK